MTSTSPAPLANILAGISAAEVSGEISALEQWVVRSDDPQLRERGEQAIWSLLDKWVRARSESDAGRTDSAVGRWELSDSDRRVLDAGLIDPRFNLDGIEAAAQADFVDRSFRIEASPVPVLTLSMALLSDYRRRLGVDARESTNSDLSDAEAALVEKRDQLPQFRAQIERLLEAQPDGKSLLSQQAKLDVILPEFAKATRLSRQGGLTPQDRRLHLKINEAFRRLSQGIVMAMGTYELRKSFESLQNQLVDAMVEVQMMEASIRERASESPVAPTVDECRQAGSAALSAIRVAMATLARCTGAGAPPFVMEHAPRMSPVAVLEKVAAVLRAAPKLTPLLDTSPLEVLILPGIGNPVFDAEADRVLVALFPIEVKLHSILSAFGEALVRRNPRWIDTYRAAKKLDHSAPVWDHFRRDFVAWVEADSLGRRTLDTGSAEWFAANLA